MSKQKIYFAFIMATINAGFISFILTAYNAGFPHNFVSMWLQNYAIAFVIVVLSILFLGPIVTKIVQKLS
jgi:hypothetical protein